MGVMKMKTATLAVLAFAAASGLAACGGGGSDGDSVLNGDVPLPDDNGVASSAFDDFGTLISRFEGDPTTQAAELPVSGAALYQGNALFTDATRATFDEIRANPAAASSLTLTADFGTAEINGRLYDFEAANPNVDIDGELAMSADLGSNTFIGRVDGVLVENGIVRDYSGGDVLGAFIGPNYEGVEGRLDHAPGTQPYTGWFVGER
jgi:hypothetical protein